MQVGLDEAFVDVDLRAALRLAKMRLLVQVFCAVGVDFVVGQNLRPHNLVKLRRSRLTV